ncbi:DUF4350 domain-containing protein [Streptomyces sp. NPDC059851]|uniref:DUF4350 domain-containing protein n=1 Tax=Streptomyces sp. NPDC059851 TaxID=3346971 RepID=UPI003666C752
MTAPTPNPAAAPAGSGATDTPDTPTARPGMPTGATGATPAAVWRRARGFLLALAVLLTAGIILAALSSGTHQGRLDPRSPGPEGSRAVAELLRARGVATRVVTTAEDAAAAAGPRTTLLVTDPNLLGDRQLRSIRSAIDLSGGRTVLLAPGTAALDDLAPAVRTAGRAHERTLAPSCSLSAATTAGPADTGDGLRYGTTTAGATACYPSGGHPTVLVLPSTTGGDTVLLGSEHVLLNEDLAREGNASLALQLLGSRPDLVWYLPSLAELQDGEAEEKSFLELIPAGWHWALLQLFVAAALAALWRARRLGPLVTERLPVAVRASEATEGRARLYRRTGARDRAATVLRAASRERLAALVGVPSAHTHDPATLVPAVAARLADPAGRDLTALLFGTTPAGDAALVALADHLDDLEREVRTS